MMHRPVPQIKNLTQIPVERDPVQKGKGNEGQSKDVDCVQRGAMDAQDGEKESTNKRSNWHGAG